MSKVTGKGTLLLSDLGAADMRNEAEIGCAEVGVVLPGLPQAQSPIDGKPDIRGVVVFLAVVFPPAHRAQSHCARRVQCPASAARAPKTNLSQALHISWTRLRSRKFTRSAFPDENAPGKRRISPQEAITHYAAPETSVRYSI